MAFQDVGLRVIILGVSQYRRDINSINQSMNSLNRTFASSTGPISKLGSAVSSLGSTFVSFGRTLTYTVTLPVTAAITGLVAAGISFEDAFSGVSKTVDGIADDLGTLTPLGEEIRKKFIDLSLVMPVSVNELARVGQAAGQVGVEAENLVDFTIIATQMGVATNIASDDAAIALARLANIMGISSEDFIDWSRRAGSAIVELGNNVAASEKEIVDLALRIAPAASIVGLTTQEILGMSAALAEVQVRSERGGTAVSRVFLEMLEASGSVNASIQQNKKEYGGMEEALRSLRTQLQRGNTDLQDLQIGFKDTNLVLTGLGPVLGDFEEGLISIDDVIRHVRNETILDLESTLSEAQGKISVFADIMGVSADEFAAAFGAKPLETFQRFLVELTRLQDEGLITSDTLAKIGLSGVRVREILNILGPNINLVTDAVDMSNQAWIEQTALQVEFQKKMATTKAQLQLLKNVVVALGISIFDYLKPSLDDTIHSITDFISGLRDAFDTLDEGGKRSVLKFIGLIAALGPGLTVVGFALKGIGLALGTFGTFTSLLGVFTNPLLLAGIAAFVGLGAVVGGFGPLVDAFQGIVDIFKGFDPSLNPMERLQLSLKALAEMPPELIPVFNTLHEIVDTVDSLVTSFITMGRYYGIFDEVIEGFKNLAGFNFSDAADNFKLAWQLLVPWIEDTLVPAIRDALPDSVKTLYDRVAAAIGRIVEGISGFIDEVSKTDGEDIKQIFESIAIGLGALAGAITIGLQLGLPVLGIGLRTLVDVVAELTRGDVAGAIRALASGLGDLRDQDMVALGAAVVVLALALKIPFIGAILSAVVALGKFVGAALLAIIPFAPFILAVVLAAALIYAYTTNLYGFKDAIDSVLPRLEAWVGVWRDFKEIIKWFWDNGLMYVLGVSGAVGAAPPSTPAPGIQPINPQTGGGGTDVQKLVEDAVGSGFKALGLPNPFKLFARGGVLKGWGIVGDKGPELVYSPGSSLVLPNNLTSGLLATFRTNQNLARAITGMVSAFGGAQQGGGPTNIFAPNVYGVPMNDEQSMGRELVRSYRMAQVVSNV